MNLLHKFRGVLSKQVIITHLTLTQRECSRGKGSLTLPTDQRLMKACDLVEQKRVEKNSWPHYDMYKCEIRLAIKNCLYLKIIHAEVLSRR